MQAEFPHEPGLIYLNHAGVAPLPRRAAEAVRAFAAEAATRGARNYPRWLAVEASLRQRLARLLGTPSSDDIALVKNTSEGLSMVAYGLDWQPGDAVIINNHEFPSNRIVWESLAQRFGVEVRDVDLDAAPTPEDALIDALDARARLLAVSSVQFGSGLRMDLVRLAQACRSNGTLLCVDAIQSLGALRLDVASLQADFVIADGHKWMLGPEGLGVFYSRPEARERLKLTQYGWHMVEQAGDFDRRAWEVASSARRFECGSPNMLGIHALEASLALLEEVGLAEVEARVLANARLLIEMIAAQPRLELMSPPHPERHAGIVTFRVIDRDSRDVFRHLQEQGVVCALRSGGIRFSPHFYNTQSQLEEALAQALRA
ncbi:MAG: aminotransferase class V-fold PLP-dependent enzyme [Xanthomonadaceae bacterium]|nr:aminotransferase class V-fold PLP-dependent enzyme [Xanthomonadaceae bacterium]